MAQSRRRAGVAVGFALVAAVVFAGCGGDGDGDESAAPVSLVDGEEAVVDALDNSFRPAELSVPAGTEVVFANRGRNDHNVLPVEGDGWGAEVADFAPGDEYRHRFTEPGTYDYYCSLHGTETRGMVGTLEVTG